MVTESVSGFDFQQIFAEHAPALFRWAYRLTGSAADAEEIVQECFLALLRPGRTFDPGRAPVRTYLYGAVRNQALKRLRRREVPGDGNEPRALEDSPQRRLERQELSEAVAEAMARLTDGQREVVVLAHYEQLPISEIADILQIDAGAVKSRLQRARAALKELLAAHAGKETGR